MGKNADSVGIAFKSNQIVPLRWRNHLFVFSALIIAEIAAYRFLARMTERRVAEVVSKASGRDDYVDVGKLLLNAVAKSVSQFAGNHACNGTAHTGNFNAMSQSVMNNLTARKRKNLGFILQTAESR